MSTGRIEQWWMVGPTGYIAPQSPVWPQSDQGKPGQVIKLDGVQRK